MFGKNTFKLCGRDRDGIWDAFRTLWQPVYKMATITSSPACSHRPFSHWKVKTILPPLECGLWRADPKDNGRSETALLLSRGYKQFCSFITGLVECSWENSAAKLEVWLNGSYHSLRKSKPAIWRGSWRKGDETSPSYSRLLSPGTRHVSDEWEIPT